MLIDNLLNFHESEAIEVYEYSCKPLLEELQYASRTSTKT